MANLGTMQLKQQSVVRQMSPIMVISGAILQRTSRLLASLWYGDAN